jgi:sucrose-6-phosphate hydrolase SacC (GH32 family)
VLTLPDSWVWDFWFAEDGDRYHLFFLYASRALRDPDARHYRASIGHAVSENLVDWTRVTDALVRSDSPAFDDLATWTGSIVRHPDGTWFLFYTGTQAAPDGANIQQIGYATSTDLLTWEKSDANPILEADSRWYETLAVSQWHEEAFRDPWVFADEGGDGWHMLITARGKSRPADDRGVIGHAWSRDLRSWELLPPLSAPGQGFGQLEVTQVQKIDGVWVLLFSCFAGQASAKTRSTGTSGGTWMAAAEGPLGPFDITGATQITDDRFYSGKLLKRRTDGEWLLFAFHNLGEDGEFVGSISDPMPFDPQRQAVPDPR